MNTIVYVHIMYKFILANFFLIVYLQFANIHMYVEMLVKFRYTKSTFSKIEPRMQQFYFMSLTYFSIFRKSYISILYYQLRDTLYVYIHTVA